MLRNWMTGVLGAGLLLAVSLPALADAPTVHEVYAVANAGHFAQAEQMMQTVLQQHPDSAKAHYIDAEILSRDGKLNLARSELARAEQLDPALSFAKPAAVHALEASLAASDATSSGVSTSHRTGFPWGLMLMGIAGIFLVFAVIRLFSARNTNVIQGNPYQPNGMMNNPYGTGPTSPMGGGAMGGGMGGGMMGGGAGSGIMSGLVTGAAVGAGMVAGEELAHHFLDGDHNAVPAGNDDNWGSSVNNDMGGSDFGVNDAGSWDDGSSAGGSDFGGGDDWS